MESELVTPKQRDMSPEIKKCKEEKFDFYEWEECGQTYNNTSLSYYPISYTSPATTQTTLQRYSFEEQEAQTKPRMSFSISSILGTHEASEDQRFHSISTHSPRYRESLLLRNKSSAFRESLKQARMKRHFLQEHETAKVEQEKSLKEGKII